MCPLAFVARVQARLARKVAIVTGGAGGIGRTVCQTLAKEGASIGILDVDQKGMDETLELLEWSHGNSHCTIQCDISRSDDVVNAFKVVEERFGQKCSILVNNAGIDDRRVSVGELEISTMDLVLNVNLKGTILMANEFAKRLKTEKHFEEQETHGCVVNVSSMAGKIGVGRGSVYAASKAGIIGFTKSMALEFPQSKIRCNAVMPAAVDTPMFDRVKQAFPNVDTVLATTPLQRICKSQEIADACLYLVSDQSSYVNGSTLEVSRGFAC